jgi:hypothetical protein
MHKRLTKKVNGRKVAILRVTDKFCKKIFLRQSWVSDYCAIYSCGMLLSLLKEPMTKSKIKNRFYKFSAKIAPTPPALVQQVLSSEMRSNHFEWLWLREFHFETIQTIVRRHFRYNKQPTLILYGVLDPKGIPCGHSALVTAVSKDGLYLLDTMGTAEKISGGHNVTIHSSAEGDFLPVSGSGYKVAIHSPAAVLTWG